MKYFKQCIQIIPLLAISAEEEKIIKELRVSLTEYITALRCQLEKAKSEDKERIIKLSCYMCICKMKDAHRILALKNGIGACYKAGNYITASHLCREILDFKGNTDIISEDTIAQYTKYYTKMKEKGTNEIKFDSTNIGRITEGSHYLCAMSLSPLKVPSNSVRCPYDFSMFDKEHEGKLCPTCDVCKIGIESIGLTLSIN